MENRPLGRTGLRVSPLALGTWNFADPTPADECLRLVHRALDGGINLVDTADSYADGESERIVGQALSGDRRQRVILATKVHFPTSPDPNERGNSRRHILRAVEASLHRLQTEWIDLYQLHRPDFDTPQDETLRALDDLVRAGKVRYIGCSTFPAWLVMEALAISERYGLARFVTEQPPYNLLDRRIENELVPLAQRHNLALLPWSPLAGGVLAGRYQRADHPPEDSRVARYGAQSYLGGRLNQRGIEVASKVADLARERDLTPAQLALLWVKGQPGVAAPIIGPRTAAHLDDLLPVMDMTLDPAAAAALDVLVPPGSAVADFHNTSGWMKMKL